jgi:hypothetical protein
MRACCAWRIDMEPEFIADGGSRKVSIPQTA